MQQAIEKPRIQTLHLMDAELSKATPESRRAEMAAIFAASIVRLISRVGVPSVDETLLESSTISLQNHRRRPCN